MGNWRTVTLTGTVSEADQPALQHWVNIGRDYSRFHALCNTGSLMGVNGWADSTTIERTGNLAERDYDVDQVAAALKSAVELAPSLALKVHCGGGHEDPACVATITVADQTVTIGSPEVEHVGRP